MGMRQTGAYRQRTKGMCPEVQGRLSCCLGYACLRPDGSRFSFSSPRHCPRQSPSKKDDACKEGFFLYAYHQIQGIANV